MPDYHHKSDPGATSAAGGGHWDPVVLHVVPSLAEPGYAQRCCVDLALTLRRLGGTPVVAAGPGALVRPLKRADIAIEALPLENPGFWTRHRLRDRLAKLIASRGVSIVHAWSSSVLPCILGPAVAARLPLVVQVDPAETAGATLRHLVRLSQRGRCCFFTESTQMRDALVARLRVDPGAVATLRPTVDQVRFAPENLGQQRMISLARAWGLPDDRTVLLAPGGLLPCGGHFDLFDAVAELGRPDLRCIVPDAGRWPRPVLKRLLRRLAHHQAAPMIQLLEGCSDRPAAYQLASIVVHTPREARHENRMLLEAQAMGRPLVATDVGAAAELLLPDGRTGWLVPPGDPGALARGLSEALALSLRERQRIADRGRQFVATHFSPNALAADLYAFYATLLGQTFDFADLAFPG